MEIFIILRSLPRLLRFTTRIPLATLFVLFNQAGKLAVQHQAFITLQARLQQQLGEYQKKCTLQEREIMQLRR